MALDERKKQLFIDVATSQGHDPNEIDAFLSQATEESGGIQPQSLTQTIPTEIDITPSPEVGGERDDFIKEALDIKVRDIKPAAVNRGFDTSEDLGPITQMSQEKIIPSSTVTQEFGNKSNVEVFSGGINNGTDFGVKKGTPVSVPGGQWKVMESFGGSSREGFIGNKDNNGFGNSVLVQNQQSGETIRFSHLSKVGVKPGQIIDGGQVVALSGNTGNSTGDHLDVEYRDPSGRLKDVLSSRYAGAF